MNALHKLLSLPHQTLEEKGILYTPKEIENQPSLWIKNFENLKGSEEISSFFSSRLLSTKKPKVVLSGAGSSAFAGLSTQNLLRKRWKIDVETIPTTDIVTHWDSLLLEDQDYIYMSLARSGNSPESVGALSIIKKYTRADTVIITCNKEGELAKQESSLLLLLPSETNDKGLAMTSSFTTMVSTLQFLAYIDDVDEYSRIVKSQTSAVKDLFENYSRLIEELSSLSFERAIFLGGGALYGCATESHLKLEEMTDGAITCKAESFMGVRHGPMASIDDKTLVVFLVSSEPHVRRYELDLMEEIKEKNIGMRKVVVCMSADDKIRDYADDIIELDKNNTLNIPDLCRPTVDVVVAQMLGLFKSFALGLKPDNPSKRNVISRTVKGVKIYE